MKTTNMNKMMKISLISTMLLIGNISMAEELKQETLTKPTLVVSTYKKIFTEKKEKNSEIKIFEIETEMRFGNIKNEELEELYNLREKGLYTESGFKSNKVGTKITVLPKINKEKKEIEVNIKYSNIDLNKKTNIEEKLIFTQENEEKDIKISDDMYIKVEVK